MTAQFRNEDHAVNSFTLLAPVLTGGVIGLVPLCFSTELPSLLKAVLMAIAVALCGLGAVLAIWSLRNITQARNAHLNTLDQGALIDMIGKDEDTSIETGAVVHTLDRRFPDWRNATRTSGRD